MSRNFKFKKKKSVCDVFPQGWAFETVCHIRRVRCHVSACAVFCNISVETQTLIIAQTELNKVFCVTKINNRYC
jgi:hypothetical protein